MTQDDAILAAVRAEVIAYGFRRATMTSVARRAGMSRATLYRRGATLDDLVREALVADFAAAASDALPQVPSNETASEPADGEAGVVTRDVIVRAAITTLVRYAIAMVGMPPGRAGTVRGSVASTISTRMP